MKLDLIKSKHGFKIISYCTKDNPALKLLGELLSVSNKHHPIKIGVYSIGSGEFSLKRRVKSYLSGKTEYMNKRDYNKWIRGDKQIKVKEKVPPIKWISEELNLEELISK